MFAFLMRIHLMTLHEVREETAVCSIQTDKTHSTTIPRGCDIISEPFFIGKVIII